MKNILFPNDIYVFLQTVCLQTSYGKLREKLGVLYCHIIFLQLQHHFPKTNSRGRITAANRLCCLTVCQMALCVVASSLNRRGGFTPGFIPVHLTGMSDSSMHCGASPIYVFCLQLSLLFGKSAVWGFRHSWNVSCWCQWYEQTKILTIWIHCGGFMQDPPFSLSHTQMWDIVFISDKNVSMPCGFPTSLVICLIRMDCHR